MSTSPETILITVDIKANTERLVELRKEINANAEAQKALAAANKAGNLSGDDLAAGQIRLKTAATALTQETRALTSANEAQEKSNKASAGSIEKLRAELALGTKAYNALSQSERDKTVAGQKLQANNKAISDSLKQLEGAIGDNRRQVGGYREAIEAALGGLEKFGSSARALPGPLGAIGSGLVGTASGFVTATRAALAFLATPIGLVLGLVSAAIYAVKTAFESSAEGQGKYSRLMAQVGVVAGNVRDVIATLGEKLIAAFENPQESLKNLGELIKQNFVNRFVGLLELLPRIGTAITLLFKGQFSEAGKVAADAVGKVTLGINSVTDAYASASQSLSNFGAESLREADKQAKASELKRQAGKLERQLITERAEADDKIATLQLQARQKEQFAAGQRKGFLLEANRLSDELFAKETKVATLRRDAGAIEATLSKQTRDDLNEQANRQKDVIEANTRAIDARRGNQRLLNALNAEVAADAQKANADAIRAEQTKAERLLLVTQEGTAAELAIKQRLVQLAADLEIASAKKTAAEKDFIQAKADAAAQKLQEDFNQKAIEDAKKHDAATVAEANREYAEAQKALEDYLNAKRAAIERDYAAGKIGEFEYQKQLDAIQKAGNAAALVNAKDYAKETGAIEKKAADDELKRLLHLKDEKKKIASIEQIIREQSILAATTASDAVIEAFGAESEAGRIATDIKKALALTEIAINLEKQLSANAVTGGKISESGAPYTVPLGIAYTVATDAAAIAGALAAGAKIAGFATGGYVSGPGTSTSDSIPARLSNGESVMNANSTAMFAPLLSHLNVLGGGVAFASGGLVPGSPARATSINDGGLLARQLGGAAPAMDYPTLIKAIAEYGDFNVGVKALTKETARYNSPRAQSTLGG